MTAAVLHRLPVPESSDDMAQIVERRTIAVSQLQFGWKEMIFLVSAVVAIVGSALKVDFTVAGVVATQQAQSKELSETREQVKELQRQIQLNQYDTRRLQEKVDDLTNTIKRRGQ